MKVNFLEFEKAVEFCRDRGFPIVWDRDGEMMSIPSADHFIVTDEECDPDRMVIEGVRQGVVWEIVACLEDKPENRIW